MNSERIFNIFIFFEDGIATFYGIRHHRRYGSDDDKKLFLKEQIPEDLLIAQKFLLPRTFTPLQWYSSNRVGNNYSYYFNEAFSKFRANNNPFMAITTVVNGVPKVDFETDMMPFRGDHVARQMNLGTVPDYLVHYMDGENFKLTQLIDDDYFKAIKLLFSERLYISCCKLLVSCIDTLSFVEFGPTRGGAHFTKWLNTYLDLEKIGVTSAELWEYRNSLLHMTNLESEKVKKGDVMSIAPYVSNSKLNRKIDPNKPKFFNLIDLIDEVTQGICKWAITYNHNHDKLINFIERYDSTVSDCRVAIISKDELI